MDYFWLCIISFVLATYYIWLTSKQTNKSSSKSRQPPGPRGWPVIGNLLDVGMMPHQNLHKLRLKYGPVIFVKLGMSNTLVVQSAKAAEELLKKHDLQFCDRRVPDSFMVCDLHKGLLMAPYGEYWRAMRKLSATELFTQKRIARSSSVRQACIDNMIQWIRDDSAESLANGGTGEIQLDKYLTQMNFNQLSNFLISRDISASCKTEKGGEFDEAMAMYFHWNGIPNMVDAFPFLRWIDPQGIRRNTKKYSIQLLRIIGEFVEERIQEKLSGKKDKETNDFLDSLLEYNGTGEIDKLSQKNVTVVLLEMFVGGTDTSSSTVVWGLTELLRNPTKLMKLKDEILQVIGDSRSVEDDDITNLAYLQAVVKEIMRLHPAGPLLVPREAREEGKFMGYHIPKKTVVFVNVWGIHRDPDSWEDPLSFKPERFLNSNIDSKGQQFELIPFGSGRRSCIGMSLGNKMVALTLARLVQSFNWKLPADMLPESLDMTEEMGIALHKLVPLVAVPC